jgi:hypothetical protein
MNIRGTFLPVALALLPLLAWGGAVRAQTPAPATWPGVRVEARFVDRATGQEAGWGATGQILLPAAPGDAHQRWTGARTVAVSPSRQSATLAPGAPALIRVGREIPFAGWLLAHGTRCGWVEQGAQWREVESALEIELLAPVPGPDGALRVALTPEFGYLQGRGRRAVAYPGERVELALQPGVETRLTPDAQRAGFYGRLLAGYDPLRRVGPVDLLLRAERADPVEP